MSFLWEIDEFLAALGGRPVGNMPQGVSGISIDSRSLGEGEAFFAIKGDRVDGHDYATRAAANGAAVLVVSEAKLPALGSLTVPLVVVDDVLKAMEMLGRAARARSEARIIAVTGSAGKTTTKEMLRVALAPSGAVHASIASFNNHWGVPLMLSRMPKTCDFGIFEIGMNHPGEIRALVDMVRPDIAIVTTVVGAHLGNFADIGEIARAKGEIAEGIVPGGHIILNRDNDQFDVLNDAAKANDVASIHTFGAREGVSFQLLSLDAAPDQSLLTADIAGEQIDCVIGAPGRHVAENALAVLGAIHVAGGDLKAGAGALEAFKATKGRGERHILSLGGDKGHFTLIDESYNANPASMRAAIALLAATPVEGEGRRIAVLGDMLEMGAHAHSVHAGLAEPLISQGITNIWLAGPDMVALRDALGTEANVTYRASVEELLPFVLENVRPGDVLAVKSSLGTGFGKITAALLDTFAPA